MIRATVNAAALAGALRDGVAQSSGPLPILQHALIETTAAGLRITTTDLETMVRTEIPAEVTKQGAACVQVQLMRAAAAVGSDLALDHDADFMIVKRGPRSRVKVPTLPAQDWPAPDAFEWSPSPVSWEDLAGAIDTCAYATSRKDIRPFCTSVCMSKGWLACSDGFRIALSPSQYAGADMMIPIRAVPLLRKYLSPGCELLVGSIRNEAMRISVSAGTDRLEVKLHMPQRIPDMSTHYPSGTPAARVKFDRTALRAAVARLLPFCCPLDHSKGARFPLAKLEHKDGALLLEDRSGENTDTATYLEAEGEISGAINLEFLGDALDAIDAPEVLFEQHGSGGSSSCRFILTAADHRAKHCISGASL